MPAVSTNIITKDQVDATCRAVESVLENLFRDGDEIVIVDTGSTKRNFKALKERLSSVRGVRIIDARYLSKDLKPYLDKWLPQLKGRLKKDGQYANLKGILSFAEAREVARKESKNEVCFWLDTDDVLVDKTNGRLREIVDQAMEDPETAKSDAVFLDYHYAFTEDGAVSTILKRERFFFRDRYHWVGRCHETAIPQPGIKVRSVGYWQDLPAYIVHTDDRKPGIVSDIRNYIILRSEVEEIVNEDGPSRVDPRTLFYLANSNRGLAIHVEATEHRKVFMEEALRLYKNFDQLSGSVEDRFASAYYIANIYMDRCFQRPITAADWYTKCIELRPFDPRGYFGLARSYGALYRWRESLLWYDFGCTLPEPKQQLHSYDPSAIHYYPHQLAFIAHCELKNYDAALACLERAGSYRATEEVKNAFKVGQNNKAGLQFTDSLHRMLQHMPNKNVALAFARDYLAQVPAVPPDCEKMGLAAPEALDERDASQREIVIFCGSTPEAWGPNNKKTGVGGSEKMVILMASKLAKLGYRVSVYAEIPPDQRGVDDDGVSWQHWGSIDLERKRWVVLYWRNPQGPINIPIRAEHRIIWNHDVQNADAYTEDSLAITDSVQLQSQFHADSAPGLREKLGNKLWIARNAIDDDLIHAKWKKAPERNPKKVVFMSSPDRGLATALMVVKAAQSVDPDVEVTVMYGWSPYARKAFAINNHRPIPDLNRDACTDDHERLCCSLLDATRARMLHRVGFEEVIDELMTAGVWLYPTRFPEISCMSAMEAQACGVLPLTTNFAALKETVLLSDFADHELPSLIGKEADDAWVVDSAKKLLELTRIPADHKLRFELRDAALGAFGATALAESWISHFKTLDAPAEHTGGQLAGAVSSKD